MLPKCLSFAYSMAQQAVCIHLHLERGACPAQRSAGAGAVAHDLPEELANSPVNACSLLNLHSSSSHSFTPPGRQ